MENSVSFTFVCEGVEKREGKQTKTRWCIIVCKKFSIVAAAAQSFWTVWTEKKVEQEKCIFIAKYFVDIEWWWNFFLEMVLMCNFRTNFMVSGCFSFRPKLKRKLERKWAVFKRLLMLVFSARKDLRREKDLRRRKTLGGKLWPWKIRKKHPEAAEGINWCSLVRIWLKWDERSGSYREKSLTREKTQFSSFLITFQK